MSKPNDTKLIDQIDLTADLLISQLVELKDRCHKLRSDLAGVSTPALGNGHQVLSDQAISTALNNRQRTITKRHKK